MTAALSDRADFPVLDELTYLNTASIGLVPASIVDSTEEFARELATRGTTWFDEEQETRALEGARTAAAELFDVDAHDVAVGSSFTELLAQLAWALAPGSGRNIVSIDIDFPSVTRVWQRIASQTGAEVRWVRVVGDPGSLDTARVIEAIDERTAVVCVSHVQYSTGYVLDLAAVTRAAREVGAVVLVDATQAAGQVPLRPKEWGVDALLAGGYKWLGGMFGAAVAYVRPGLLAGRRPPIVGWLTDPEPYTLEATRLQWPDGARTLEASTSSYSAALALGLAIRYSLGLGVDRVRAHGLALAATLADGLRELGADLLSPEKPSEGSGIVTVRFPGHDADRITAQLNARGVVVSPRLQATRFSVHHHTNGEEVAHALQVAREVLGADK
ncbi:aminotransferase class V-fold PLP-dependent enzyme [Amycolatopsis taiwanensis]|uniref:aminotransferase class V-fold PLP-dependent enzyme n=1 Tax=Amycolatopsis taiwanensis TaxID=342230 RepID=UPI00047FFF95|nr:aminotransferase class V-fold PLP-dependent enzyme [Amycolatopsis taiwanensis]